MSNGTGIMTTATFDYTCASENRGIAGLAVRLGHALEGWGRRAARPLDRDEVARRIAVQRELREGVAQQQPMARLF
jgi:hypothetical protein